jgi:predicted NAD-dependent protein-ADP-ribosyltransferase YbiA (DUF1768 family)
MQNILSYFVKGKIIVISRDENERSIHYNVRLKYILERFEHFSLSELESYSRIYINHCFYNATYPPQIVAKLLAITNFDFENYKKAHEAIYYQEEEELSGEVSDHEEEDLEVVKDALVGNVIEEVTPEQISLENGEILVPSEPLAEFKVVASTVDKTLEEIPSDEVIDVGFKPLVSNNEQAPSTSTFTIETAEPSEVTNETSSEVQNTIQACVVDAATDECEKPSGVILSTDDGLEVQVDPPEESEVELIMFLNVGEDDGYLTLEFPTKIVIKDLIFNNALQYATWLATKDNDPNAFKTLTEANIGKLKSLASKSDNGIITEDIMYEANLQKFTQNADLKVRLMATGDSELFYNNDNDNYWGKTWGIKSGNKLGNILMRVRRELERAAEAPIIQELKEEQFPAPTPDEVKATEVELTKEEQIPVESNRKLTAEEIREKLSIGEDEEKSVTLDDGTKDYVASNRSKTEVLLKSGVRVPYEKVIAVNDVKL